jgi:tRNA 2-thiouridine synthesizing protein A
MGLFGSGKKDNNAASSTQVTLSDGNVISVATRVDCLGDSCPRPQLMTKKAVNGAAANDIIEIAVDNPTSMEALPPMCPQLSATHLETVAVDNGWHVYIQKN